MQLIQIIILIITLVLWAIIGFIFWIPILFRSTASLTGGILYCTITETDPVYLKASFQNAVSFYARGFESISFVFSDKRKAEPQLSCNHLCFVTSRAVPSHHPVAQMTCVL
jgi:hypothetical protein